MTSSPLKKRRTAPTAVTPRKVKKSQTKANAEERISEVKNEDSDLESTTTSQLTESETNGSKPTVAESTSEETTHSDSSSINSEQLQNIVAVVLQQLAEEKNSKSTSPILPDPNSKGESDVTPVEKSLPEVPEDIIDFSVFNDSENSEEINVDQEGPEKNENSEDSEPSTSSEVAEVAEDSESSESSAAAEISEDILDLDEIFDEIDNQEKERSEKSKCSETSAEVPMFQSISEEPIMDADALKQNEKTKDGLFQQLCKGAGNLLSPSDDSDGEKTAESSELKEETNEFFNRSDKTPKTKAEAYQQETKPSLLKTCQSWAWSLTATIFLGLYTYLKKGAMKSWFVSKIAVTKSKQVACWVASKCKGKYKRVKLEKTDWKKEFRDLGLLVGTFLFTIGIALTIYSLRVHKSYNNFEKTVNLLNLESSKAMLFVENTDKLFGSNDGSIAGEWIKKGSKNQIINWELDSLVSGQKREDLLEKQRIFICKSAEDWKVRRPLIVGFIKEYKTYIKNAWTPTSFWDLFSRPSQAINLLTNSYNILGNAIPKLQAARYIINPDIIEGSPARFAPNFGDVKIPKGSAIYSIELQEGSKENKAIVESNIKFLSFKFSTITNLLGEFSYKYNIMDWMVFNSWRPSYDEYAFYYTPYKYAALHPPKHSTTPLALKAQKRSRIKKGKASKNKGRSYYKKKS